MCQNPEKNIVLNWPPSEMTKSRTCHPKKNVRVQNLPLLNSPEMGTLPFLEVAGPELCHFSGWPVQCRTLIFKASALWADAFYKSKCLSVCVSMCPFVCSLLRYRLNVFLPPLPKVECPFFLEIRNPWGKVMERCGLRFKHFCLEVV